MRAALIPPIPELPRFQHYGIHLILSHLLKDKRYTRFYRDRRDKGDYLILDNGAHENGAGESPEVLIAKADALGVQELVLPDVLFDRRGTIERTKQMLKWIAGPGWSAYCIAGCPRLMVVPQGKDRADWAACLASLLRTWDYWTRLMPGPISPPVIGISKDYDEFRGGLPYMIGHYIEPVFKDRPCDIHCLGWPNDLWAIAIIARMFPWVRSTDSAKPFVYAKNAILLEPGGNIPKYPRRDPDYFTEDFTTAQRTLALRNVSVFCATATDELVGSPGLEDAYEGVG